jgi:uncharacterized damage-inducible protein DinB
VKVEGPGGLLVRMIDEAYEKKAWHGANLRGSLRGVGVREAAWRPAPNRHSVRELALHAAYWKYAVWRRLTGVKRGSFPLDGSNWFARPDVPTEKEWRNDLALLDEQHRRLRKAAAELPAARLAQSSPGTRVSNATLLYGIAAHDAYHTGQIQLVRRLFRERAKRRG